MIDRGARDLAGAALRRLATGRITNDEFEDQCHGSPTDAGVRAVLDAAWELYSDLYEHRVEVAARERRVIARAIVFLRADQEYKWPEVPIALRLLLLIPNLLTLGLLGGVIGWWVDRHGDSACWPFVNRSDLEMAIASFRWMPAEV